MQAIDTKRQRATVELELDELLMLSNSLNEVCNGVSDLSGVEFATRMGFERDEVRVLLSRIHELIAQVRKSGDA